MSWFWLGLFTGLLLGAIVTMLVFLGLLVLAFRDESGEEGIPPDGACFEQAFNPGRDL